MRTLSQLIDFTDSAWPLVQEWIGAACVSVEVLPAERAIDEAALYTAQVTTRSPMGAIVFHISGILIDDGWLRVLGAGGHPRFERSLPVSDQYAFQLDMQRQITGSMPQSVDDAN